MCEKIYCLRCKDKTATKNIKEAVSKKGQPMLKGNCIICNSKKSKYIKKKRKYKRKIS